jgi:hypothetical protein
VTFQNRFPFARAVGLALSIAGSSFAQAPSGERKQATELFEQGGKLFLDKRYEDALAVLERSYKLYPSPNSLLLIARCERDLGRLEVAAGHFSDAASAADARVTGGEAQYQKSAESARTEGAAVRAMLGTLRVRVKDAPTGTVVETQYTRALVDGDGSVELPHRAGSAELVVRAPNGRVIEKTVRVSARAWTDVEVAFAKAEATAAEPEAEPTPGPAHEERPVVDKSGAPSWMLPTGAVLTGVGVVGLASFAYFGTKSKSTYDDLEQSCGHACSDAERDQADRGKRQQTIANVSLVVGGAAVATGVALIVVALSKGSSSKATTKEAARAALTWSPRGFAF